ncbi:hypothetical protein, partial [Brevibacterium metallidurans]
MADDNEVAVLVGNGLSIAHNPKLILKELTAEVVERLQNDEESDSADLMEALARNTLPEGVTSDDDFERLVGALDLESTSLEHVRQFADLRNGEDSDLSNAITLVRGLLEDTRDIGVSHVLEAVTEYTEGRGSNFAHVRNLVRAIVDEFS